MYASCIFCNNSLGLNTALEHFQVGRRLAYDAGKGRLWVVCGRCERWNLTPLETRWEAIEEAERAFRASRMRVSTDNIGLAQLKEGLELVRIGAPPPLEMAGWRYGDQFGRRLRKHLVLGTAAAVASPLAYSLGALTGVMVAGSGAGMLYSLALWGKMWYDTKVPKAIIRDNDGNLLHLSRRNINAVALVKGDRSDHWYLRLQHRQRNATSTGTFLLRGRNGTVAAPDNAILTEVAAYRALAKILPWVNRAGGSSRRVREAVDVIQGATSVHQLLASAAVSGSHRYPYSEEQHLASLPARTRLAMEMVLHENDERHALDGQLAELEERWREAEEIASISDSLLLPADMDERLDALRTTGASTQHVSARQKPHQ